MGASFKAIATAGLSICFFAVTAVPSLGLEEETIHVESTLVESGLPVRLKIPSIKVNSTIEYVGLTNTGAMNVPKVSGNVGWYSLGPRPGEYGSAVIAGHYSWRGNGAGGVFRNLSKLSKGDMIYVVDESGVTVSFIVRENRLFNFDADAHEVFATDRGTRLNLITCAGTWNSAEQSSTKRRVIFAELVIPITEGIVTRFAIDSPAKQ